MADNESKKNKFPKILKRSTNTKNLKIKILTYLRNIMHEMQINRYLLSRYVYISILRL